MKYLDARFWISFKQHHKMRFKQCLYSSPKDLLSRFGQRPFLLLYLNLASPEATSILLRVTAMLSVAVEGFICAHHTSHIDTADFSFALKVVQLLDWRKQVAGSYLRSWVHIEAGYFLSRVNSITGFRESMKTDLSAQIMFQRFHVIVQGLSPCISFGNILGSSLERSLTVSLQPIAFVYSDVTT